MRFYNETKRVLDIVKALDTNSKGQTSLCIKSLGKGQGQARATNLDGSEVFIMVSIRTVTPASADFVALAGSGVGKQQTKSVRLNLLTGGASGFSDETLKFLAALVPADMTLDLLKTNAVKRRSWIDGRLSTVTVKVIVTGTSKIYSATMQDKKITSIVASYERRALQASIIFDTQAQVEKEKSKAANKTAKVLRTVRSS